jgi:hypothetical protein
MDLPTHPLKNLLQLFHQLGNSETHATPATVAPESY